MTIDYDKRKFEVDEYGHLYPKKKVKGINMNGEPVEFDHTHLNQSKDRYRKDN